MSQEHRQPTMKAQGTPLELAIEAKRMTASATLRIPIEHCRTLENIRAQLKLLVHALQAEDWERKRALRVKQAIEARQTESPGDIYHRYNALQLLLEHAFETWEKQLHQLDADDALWIEGPERLDGLYSWMREARRKKPGA